MAKEIEINLEEENEVSMEVKDTGNVEIGMESDFGGTTDYNKLKNKPSINGVTLQGNKTLEELGIINYDDTEIKENITEIEKENTYQNKRLEYLEKNQIQSEVKGEDTLTVTDGAFAYANILKETEIEVEGEKKKAYIVGLPQGISRQEQREGYNKLDLENEGKELSLEYTAEYNLKYENCKEQQTLKAGAYTLALKVKSLANGSINAVSLKNVDTTVATFSGYTTTTTTEKFFIKTITVDTDVTFNRISIQNDQAGTYIIKEIMILEGTYTTENLPAYEQYGATPSIEIPSEIENVKAYNLFDTNNILENYYLNETGGTVSSTASNVSDFFQVNENNIYYLKSEKNNLVSTNNRNICFYNSEKNIIGNYLYNPVDDSTKLNIPNLTKYIRITIDKSMTNIMLVEEKNKNKPYAPYGAISIGLKNKNLLNLGEKRSIDNLGITTSIISNTKIKINGNTTSAGNVFKGLSYNTEYIRLPVLKKGTYKFISIFDGNITAVDNSYAIYLRDDTGSTLGFRTNNLNTDFTFTLNEDTNLYLQLYVNKAGVIFNGILSLQLEEGETATSYTENQEQNYNLHINDLELNGVDDIRDSFVVELNDPSASVKSIKKLYLKKKFDKSILKDLSWIIENTYQSTSSKRYISTSLNTIVKKPIANNIKSGILCNIEKEKIADLNYQANNSVAIDTSGRICFFDKSLENETDTTALIQKLTDTNAYLIYPLETPELINLTETHLELVQDIENIINNMFTYEEVTHIDTPIGYMELTYTKSNKLIIKNYDDRISALEKAILNVGGN